jgi:hypothetical protein
MTKKNPLSRRASVQVQLRVPEARAIRFGDAGFALWDRYTVKVDDPKIPYLLDLEVAVRQGRGPTCESMRCTQRPDGPTVSTEGIRRLPVAGILVSTALYAAVSVETFKSSARVSPVTAAEMRSPEFRAFERMLASGPRRRPGRRPTDDDRLEQVAEVYRAAVALGEPPTMAVHTKLSVSRSHAGRLVHQARGRGFLGKTRPGRRGEEVQEETKR